MQLFIPSLSSCALIVIPVVRTYVDIEFSFLSIILHCYHDRLTNIMAILSSFLIKQSSSIFRSRFYSSMTDKVSFSFYNFSYFFAINVCPSLSGEPLKKKMCISFGKHFCCSIAEH